MLLNFVINEEINYLDKIYTLVASLTFVLNRICISTLGTSWVASIYLWL